MNKYMLFGIFLLLLAGHAVYSQNLPAEEVNRLIHLSDSLSTTYPQEKLHLQLDKPYYSIGDTIWLKAYVVSAKDNSPSLISSVAYAELIDGRDSVKYRLRLLLNGGMASGDFTLAAELEEGSYRIRAYTSWMRNFGDDYFYDRSIRIGNALESAVTATADYRYTKQEKDNVTVAVSYKLLSGEPLAGKEVSYQVGSGGKTITKGKAITDDKGTISTTFSQAELQEGIISTSLKMEDKEISKVIRMNPASQQTDVQFFPEGGELVEGISSGIGFKATGADGLSREISGYIMEEGTNTRIAEFRSEHAGMGRISLEPKANKSYTAVIRMQDGSEKRVPLPKAVTSGYVLNAVPKDSSLLISIKLSPELIGEGEVTLLGQMNGAVAYAAKKKLTGTGFNVSLPYSRFAEGILQLTLFSPQGKPVAERLVFIHNESRRIKAAITTDKPSYTKREKVSLELNLADEQGNPLQGSFSLAVTDEGKVPYQEDKEITIFSNLLLSSDLRGTIENPNYYFTKTDTKKIKELDNLLLSQGWRRFNWNELLQDKYPKLTYAAEHGMEITGKVTTNGGDPVAGGQVILLGAGMNSFMLTAQTDQQGRFRFDSLGFSQDDKYTLQGSDAKGSRNVKVIRDEQSYPEISHRMAAPENSEAFLAYLESSRERFNEMKQGGLFNQGIILDAVTIEARKQDEIKKVALTNSSNLLGPGKADRVVTFVDMLRCNSNLGECLGLVAMGIRNMGSMLLVINGVPIAQRGELSKINASTIEVVEILKPPLSYIYGGRAKDGAILITTKRGGIDYSSYEYKNTFTRSKPLSTGQAEGYYFGRTFYSPVYKGPRLSGQPSDLRTTIYWNPDVVTGADGKARVEFFNADGTGNYRVIAEGLTGDGKLGRVVYRYIVKP